MARKGAAGKPLQVQSRAETPRAGSRLEVGPPPAALPPGHGAVEMLLRLGTTARRHPESSLSQAVKPHGLLFVATAEEDTRKCV